MIQIMTTNGKGPTATGVEACDSKGDFAAEANEVLLGIRAALWQMLEGLGVPAQEVQRAHRRLGIDQKLAWRLAKILQSGDVFAAARHMPGAVAMRPLFRRAEAEHVPAGAIARMHDAMGRFEKFANEHAANRRTLDLLLSAYADSEIEESDLVHRKEATTAMSYTWGVVAKAHLNTHIARPSADPDRLDVAALGGFVGLQWIRPNVPWVVKRTHHIDARGRLVTHRAGTPLDPGIKAGDVPLLRDYCSASLPPVRRVATGHGSTTDELIQSTIGASSQTTCLLGDIHHGSAPSYRDEEDRIQSYVCRARTPCEMFLFDFLMHRDIIADSEPSLVVYGDFEYVTEPGPLQEHPRHHLMPWKRLENLGWGIERVYTPHFTRYATMVDDCFQRLGWNPAEFRVFRAAIEHPVIPSSVVIRYDLPEKPT